MNLLLLAPEEIGPDDRVRLSGRRAEHLKGVLGVTVGQCLRAGVLGEGRGNATVLEVSEREVTLKISPREQASRLEVDVVVAIPRPKVIPRLLFALSSLGVRRIDLVNAWKVDKSYLSSPKLSDSAIAEELWLGCEQGAQTRLPVVNVHRLFTRFVEETLRQRVLEERPVGFVCHTEGGAGLEEAWTCQHLRATPPLDSEKAVVSAPVCVAVGPEGGWIDRELDTLGQLGFSRVRLVDGILRVDAACVAAVAQLELLARSMPSDAARKERGSASISARDAREV